MRGWVRRHGWIGRGWRLTVGLTIGVGTAVVGLVFCALAGLALLCVTAWPRARQWVLRPVAARARQLTELERWRLDRFLNHRSSADYANRQALRYVAARSALGLLGGLVLMSVVSGVFYGSLLVWGWFIMAAHKWLTLSFSSLGGLFLLFLSLQGMVGVAALERRLVHHLLGPSQQEALQRRIEELATSRAGVVDAVHDERRRIERDLHDGVQQRLVALGMLLGRARRSQDEEKVRTLLAQAHEESRQALTDLREVAWRVYPIALDDAGLRAALETVAERSAIPVRLDYDLPAEPSTAVRTVAYFVVSEAVTNAIKHSGAARITVALSAGAGSPGGPARGAAGGDGGANGSGDGRTRGDGSASEGGSAYESGSAYEGGSAYGGGFAGGPLLVHVTDDGVGGADPTGSGLLGLARRVAALDGTLRVLSPRGGPTTVTAELPCAFHDLPDPWGDFLREARGESMSETR
ncbi:histidine kinase [Streptomyces sp. LX-29]|uniref:sensor histidine kinase n=1 Tax=Streptomyces sp. LX-29 TaxID=2900152 RepID=UPI00240DC30D|nr:histidine kinase [Streptomyces sp. LX-29]WFB09782.1 histidine kinase [Streptomyces sp. LX-29]